MILEIKDDDFREIEFIVLHICYLLGTFLSYTGGSCRITITNLLGADQYDDDRSRSRFFLIYTFAMYVGFLIYLLFTIYRVILIPIITGCHFFLNTFKLKFSPSVTNFRKKKSCNKTCFRLLRFCHAIMTL